MKTSKFNSTHEGKKYTVFTYTPIYNVLVHTGFSVIQLKTRQTLL